MRLHIWPLPGKMSAGTLSFHLQTDHHVWVGDLKNVRSMRTAHGWMHAPPFSVDTHPHAHLDVPGLSFGPVIEGSTT